MVIILTGINNNFGGKENDKISKAEQSAEQKTAKKPRIFRSNDDLFERIAIMPEPKRKLVPGIIGIVAILLIFVFIISIIMGNSRKNPTASGVIATVTATQSQTEQPTSYSTPNDNPVGKDEFSVTNLSSGKVEHDAVPLIVAQVLENEMGGDAPPEALKAGAVAIYSFLLYHGADSGKNPSVTMTAAGAECINAAYAVQNQTIKSSGRVIEALWFDLSAGKTADNRDVWGNDVSYLKSVDSAVDKNAAGFQTTRTYTAANVAKWAKSEYNIDLSKQSDKSKWFSCKYDKSTKLYVTSVSLGGLKTVSGLSIRYNLFSEDRVGKGKTLDSHAFTVKYDKKSDSFTFTVKGKGNGVGLSIEGAKLMAQNGADYKKILTTYYTGVSVG
ncbi:MAG: SpoIID/LytB domain-containing protein [Acutalibacteraceae bacterium]